MEPTSQPPSGDGLSEVGRCAARARDRLQTACSTLSELSSESRLLALNAGCEAARIGTAGESFRIVARSIEQLSERLTAVQAELAASADDEEHVCRQLQLLRRQAAGARSADTAA